MTANKKVGAKAITETAGPAGVPMTGKAAEQLQAAIDQLEQMRGQLSIVLQSLRGLKTGDLTPAPAPPVDGPSPKRPPR